MKLKSILAFLLVAAIFNGSVPSAFAAESSANQPFILQWVNTAAIEMNLTFSNGNAMASCIISGQPSVTDISATYVLQRKNANGTYTNLITWSGRNSKSQDIIFDESYPVKSGYTYRFKASATLTAKGVSEQVSDSIEKSY